LWMFSTVAYTDLPATGPYVITKSSGPVCPACGSSGLNRIPRRFIDRLISLVYPVHRYHCQAFVCNWEGNIRHTEADHWKPLDEYTDSPMGVVAPAKQDRKRNVKSDWPSARESDPRPPAQASPLPPEGDTLPMPSSPKAADASAGSRHDTTKGSRRANKRAKPAPR